MQGREGGRKELHQETSVEDSVLNGQNALPPVTGQSEDTVGGGVQLGRKMRSHPGDKKPHASLVICLEGVGREERGTC